MGPRSNPEASFGSDLAERYRVLAKIGSGGMGDVFLVTQLGEGNFNRLVVMKRIHETHLAQPDRMRMLYDEAMTVAALNHPHIVKIYELNRLEGDVCIIMEYVDGETLNYVRESLAARRASMPLRVLCKLMIEACEALHYAHSAQTPDQQALDLVHRDIGPYNLMISRSGYLKVIDFGIAKTAQRTESTAPGVIKGKLSYLAPELLHRKEIDARADIYGLGLVFFELTTLTKAFSFDAEMGIPAAYGEILVRALPKPSSIDHKLPTELDSIIGKAIAKDREKRYQTAEVLARDIRRFAEGLPDGLASTGDVATWFLRQFDQRIGRRKNFERQALKKASSLVIQRPVEACKAMQQAALDPTMLLALSELGHSSAWWPGPLTRGQRVGLLLLLLGLIGSGVVIGVRNVQESRPAAIPTKPQESAPVPLAPPVREAPLPSSAGAPALPSTPDASPEDLAERDPPKKGARKPSLRDHAPHRKHLAQHPLGRARKPAGRAVDQSQGTPPSLARIDEPPSSSAPSRVESASPEPAAPPRPAPMVPLASRNGTIVVQSSIPGFVFVDGQNTGKVTPTRLDLPVGKHEIVVLFKGSNTKIKQDAVVTPGGVLTLNVKEGE